MSSMVRRLRRHAPADVFLATLALPTVAVGRLIVLCVPYRWWRRAIRTDVGGRSRSCELMAPRRVGWAVRAAAKFVPDATCLTQALAGRCLLRLGGHPSTLTLGVRRSAGGDIEAHAWLTSAGQAVVGQQTSEAFVALGGGETVPSARP
jgi:hypothetical protein